jgi:hypothetical protein
MKFKKEIGRLQIEKVAILQSWPLLSACQEGLCVRYIPVTNVAYVR